ncbi:hypothetical protein [Bdellovibrio sp. HCB-110]|uniref:hypothetical protein n=1 Tax=Bdellovibrio sp. HCB-110 TaxID=3391182 RepID=UPI0039B5FBBB
MKLCKWIAIATLVLSQSAQATILWAGGEEGDFSGGTLCLEASNGIWRGGYARGALYNCGSGIGKSVAFSGGTITSGWLSSQVRFWGIPTSTKLFGFGKLGTDDGIFVGIASSNQYKVAIWKVDGGSWTELASAAAASFSNGPIFKIDMQVINYGSSGTVNVYINASANPVLTYTGNISTAATSNLNGVFAVGPNNNSSGMSEIIASDADTRLLSLASLTPNAAGDTNQWTGAYTDIDETTVNDTDLINTATSGNVFQCNLSALPTGSWQVHGIKITARGTTVGGGISSIALGVKTNGSSHTQTPVSQSAVWSPFETSVYTTNPITSGAWTATEINALQIHIQSAP